MKMKNEDNVVGNIEKEMAEIEKIERESEVAQGFSNYIGSAITVICCW